METQELQIQKLETLDDLTSLVPGKDLVMVRLEETNISLVKLYDGFNERDSSIYLLGRYVLRPDILEHWKISKDNLLFNEQGALVIRRQGSINVRRYEPYITHNGYENLNKKLAEAGLQNG